MIFTIDDAMDALGLDNDTYTKNMVSELVLAIPDYIESTTGMKKEQQEKEQLCYTVSKFLITLWYFPEETDAYRLNQVINSLLKTISTRVE